MCTIHESSSQKCLKMLGSMPVVIPTWLLADWPRHPSTGYDPDHWTSLLGVGDEYSTGVSRPINNPAGQPAKHQKKNRILDCLNA